MTNYRVVSCVVRALVVGNRDDLDPGLVGDLLDNRGFKLHLKMRESPSDLNSTTQTDLLVLLGSDWFVGDVLHADKVNAELGLIRSMALRGVPIFGICFGAQLISAAFGGEVRRSHSPEIGWHEVSSDEHPELFAHSWFQWHYDIFSPPTDFQVVASNGVGVQAILGNRILGTQFHPEVTSVILEKWTCGVSNSVFRETGIDIAMLQETSKKYLEQGVDRCASLIDWFLEHVNR